MLPLYGDFNGRNQTHEVAAPTTMYEIKRRNKTHEEAIPKIHISRDIPATPDLPIVQWTCEDVTKYFARFFTYDEIKFIKEQEIDGSIIGCLCFNDFIDLFKFKFEVALKLDAHVQILRDQTAEEKEFFDP